LRSLAPLCSVSPADLFPVRNEATCSAAPDVRKLVPRFAAETTFPSYSYRNFSA
jgi:hypothetical protein